MRGRTKVVSTNIVSVGWTDENGGILEVEFHGGSVYEYKGVSRDLYQALMKAPSKGHFLNTLVKPYYKFRKVAPLPQKEAV